jgi:hypothetical protein
MHDNIYGFAQHAKEELSEDENGDIFTWVRRYIDRNC